MKKKGKLLSICIAVPVLAGAASGFITRSIMAEFRQLKKPPLSPPGWLFPVVWTILFILMGIASYLVLISEKTQTCTKALTAYASQLIVNFLWPVFFFQCKWYLFSYYWLLLLWSFVLLTAGYFYRISKKAACLMLPYIAWISYAGYLNLFIYILN